MTRQVGPPGTAPGALPSPNIWHHTQVYEIENRAVDRDGRLLSLMRDLADWTGRDVLDVGCGTGFHLPTFARAAATVTGVEPHPGLLAIAERRCTRFSHVRPLLGTAQDLPLPDASVDVVHARWAYFFGPGCEPGLAELSRVVRRGGRAFVIDNDATRSTFGGWFRRALPAYDPEAVERFWSTQGWERHSLDIAWTFDAREDLEAVVRIEFAPGPAAQFLAEHGGLEVDYAVNVWTRAF